MIQEILKINDNKKIAANVYEMTLEGNMSAITSSGQFVNIKIDGLYLRRPISVCDYTQNSLTLVYKVVGVGTEILSEKKQGDKKYSPFLRTIGEKGGIYIIKKPVCITRTSAYA